MVSLIAAVLMKAAVVLGVAKIVPGVRVQGYGSAIAVAVTYGLLHWGLKSALVFLSLPLILVTFGVFLLVLNGILLWMTDKLLSGFKVRGLPSLALATIGITIGSLGVDALIVRLFH
jgi:putative membrane protein